MLTTLYELIPADRDPRTDAAAVAAVLWLVLLFWPLTGVNRRDPLTGATYVLFLVAAGSLHGAAALGAAPLSRSWVLGFAALMFAGGLRWVATFVTHDATVSPPSQPPSEGLKGLTASQKEEGSQDGE